MSNDTPRERNVGMEDQCKAAVDESEQIALLMAKMGGIEPKIHEPGQPLVQSASHRVYGAWVESINGDGPKGLCMHLQKPHGPQPYGGLPFMPGGLFCIECILAVMDKIQEEPEMRAAVPCAACDQSGPLYWGSITQGMHTLYFGLCRACTAENELAEDASR